MVYDAARVHALAAARARADTSLAEGEREARAESYAAAAVELLERAVERGFDDASRMRLDMDLQVLRKRPAFRDLVVRLQEAERAQRR